MRCFYPSSTTLFVCAGFSIAFYFGTWFTTVSERWRSMRNASHSATTESATAHTLADRPPPIQQSEGRLILTPQVVKSLELKAARAQPAVAGERLVLAGSLALDSAKLAVVHSRFSGEVIEIGQVGQADPAQNSKQRQIRIGDRVHQGQLLAVVWSKEIGEKKSDLVEALSRQSVSFERLKRLEGLERGVVSGQVVSEARQTWQSDTIAVERAERTLRSWRETEEEITEVYAEADRIRRGDDSKRANPRQTWANVEIRAPLDGVVLDRNVSAGEIVETGTDMFKIADLSRMSVLANVYEEDLAKLLTLPREQWKWQIKLKSNTHSEPISGPFEVIGHVIDASQHTAAVIGWIDNPDHRLRSGQFITATIDLPGNDDAVVIPNSSIIDDGQTSLIFVATDETMHEIEPRRVWVIHRGREVATVRSVIRNSRQLANVSVLHKDELVVCSGNLELFGYLQDQATAIGLNE